MNSFGNSSGPPKTAPDAERASIAADAPCAEARRFGYGRWLLVSLALILLGDVGAWWVKNDGGTIDVTGILLPTENGQWIAADLLRPASATDKTPAPLVVVCPGFERSKETLDSYALELARRGIVVITIDPYAQGASSSSRQRRSASREGYGVVPLIEYVADTPNLNYVDKARLGATGYSAGGNAVLQAASLFGARAANSSRARNRAVDAVASPPSKLAAVFVGGFMMSMTDEVLASVRSNVGTDYARHDEGAYRNGRRDADLRTAPEALRLVNSGLPADRPVTAVEIGRPYGDVQQRTMRVVYNTPGNIHPLLPYDPRSIAHMVDFFTTVFGVSPAMPATDQRWYWKELCTLVSLVGGLLFLVPFAGLMLRVPWFRAVRQPMPPALPRPTGRGRVLFWITFVISAVIAAVLYVPLARLTGVVFPEATASRLTWWFPQRMNNAILLWAVANGALGLLVSALTHQWLGRRNGVTSDMLGMRASLPELGKTLLLALVVFAGFYALLFASYAVFHVDFRFFFVAAAASFSGKMWLVALEYLPLFFIFYFGNSVRVNGGGAFAGQKEWLGLLIAGFGNSGGLMAILVIQYVSLARTGTVFWTAEWIYINMLFGVVPMMFLLPIFNRAFFRLTGRVYLGPLVTCLVFIMMLLTSSVCYIPL